MFYYNALNSTAFSQRWCTCSSLKYDCDYSYNSTVLKDNVMHLRPSRYPTPPHTPPRGENCTIAAETSHNCQINNRMNVIEGGQCCDGNPLRTQTVIMKIGHVNSSLRDGEKDPSQCQGSSAILTNSERFICEWLDCSRLFRSLDSLAAHVTQTHAVSSRNDGLYYCHWSGCQRIGRGFNARYKMLVHMRTHTKEKPHQCHLCEKRFSRAENLKIHIRSHSGEKPYVCTFLGCTKAYSNSSDRFKHTRTHSIEKPYVCKVNGCQKRYTDPSSLRKHVKTFKHSLQLIKDTANPVNKDRVEGEEQQPQQQQQVINVLVGEVNNPEGGRMPLISEQFIRDDGEKELQQQHSIEQHEEQGRLEEAYALEHLEKHEFDQMPNHCAAGGGSILLSSDRAQFDVTTPHSYPIVKSSEGSPRIPQGDSFCMALEELCQIDETTAGEEGRDYCSAKSQWQREINQNTIHHPFHFPFFPAPLYELASYDNVSGHTFTELRTPSIASNAIILPSYDATESIFGGSLDWEPLDLRINRV